MANGTDLILWDNVKKPTLEKLSTGQYTEASARILRLLAPSMSAVEFDEYVDYIAQIGILLQIFTVGSVYSLDHLHRQDVYYKRGKRWDEINNTLQNPILKRKDDQYGSHSSKNSGSRKPVGQNSQNGQQNGYQSQPQSRYNAAFSPGSDVPCWYYNQADKVCRFTNCRSPHVCSIEHCRGKHPAFKHVFNNVQAGSGSENAFRPALQSK
jgi:hypothetical protein